MFAKPCKTAYVDSMNTQIKTPVFTVSQFSVFFLSFGTNISISSKKGTHKLWQIWKQNANKVRVNFFYFFHKASSYCEDGLCTDICMIYVWNKCEYVFEGKNFKNWGANMVNMFRMWPWQSINLTRSFCRKELNLCNIYIIETFRLIHGKSLNLVFKLFLEKSSFVYNCWESWKYF